MNDPIAEAAVIQAAEHGAPPKVFHVGPDAAVDFGSGSDRHPFDGITITHWTHD
jgi:hypothetical protein